MSEYAGSYKLKSVNIFSNKNKSDIIGMISEINIFSYIEQPSTTVMITMNDSTNFLNDYPIKGGQEIEIEIEFGSENRKWKVTIAAIENINSDLKTTVYNLRCVSRLLFRSHYTNVSKSYSGKVSDIAKSIFNEYKSDEEKIRIWEDSSNSSSYVIPGWSPVQTIMWLAQKSRAKNTDTRFKFFQDSFLTFNFLPLESLNELYKDNEIQTFYHNVIKTQGVERTKREMMEILEYSLNDTNNILEGFNNGFISGQLFEYNTTSKRSNNITYNYYNDFENYKEETTNKRPLWRKNDLSNTFIDDSIGSGLQIEQISRFRDDKLIDTSEALDRSRLINSFFNLSNNMITIQIKGNNVTDIGQIIKLEFPKIKPAIKGDMVDKHISGRYLVVGKRQQFGPRDNIISLDVIRDSTMLDSSYSGNELMGGEDV